MGSSSLPLNTYSRHFFLGFLASVGSAYFTKVPLTVFVSAARAPDVSMSTPSFSLDLVLLLDLDDLDLVLLLDLELCDLPRADRDLELSEEDDDRDLERENFPLLFFLRSLLRDLVLLLLLEEPLSDLLPLELLDLDLV